MIWFNMGWNTVDGIAVFAGFGTELVITVTMAVATRAPLSGKLPTPPKIRTLIPDPKIDHYISDRGVSGCCVTRCESSCKGDCSRNQSPSI